MLHYTYTSVSLSAPLAAMFPDVASKLGHERDTRTRRKGRRRRRAGHSERCLILLVTQLNIRSKKKKKNVLTDCFQLIDRCVRSITCSPSLPLFPQILGKQESMIL